MQEKFGNQSATASLIINVEDYDTLNPYFSQSVYHGNITENQVKALLWMLLLPDKQAMYYMKHKIFCDRNMSFCILAEKF